MMWRLVRSINGNTGIDHYCNIVKSDIFLNKRRVVSAVNLYPVENTLIISKNRIVRLVREKNTAPFVFPPAQMLYCPFPECPKMP